MTPESGADVGKDDPRTAWHVVKSDKTDGEGYAYRNDFSGPLGNWQPKASALHVVRRRRWVRTVWQPLVTDAAIATSSEAMQQLKQLLPGDDAQLMSKLTVRASDCACVGPSVPEAVCRGVGLSSSLQRVIISPSPPPPVQVQDR